MYFFHYQISHLSVTLSQVSEFHHHVGIFVIIPRHVIGETYHLEVEKLSFTLIFFPFFEFHHPPAHMERWMNPHFPPLPNYRGPIIFSCAIFFLCVCVWARGGGGGDEVVTTIIPYFERFFPEGFS
jgi:hypothetical protein